MNDADPPVLIEIIEATGIIRFNRPEKRNSLSQDVLGQLERALASLLPRDNLAAMIFTGTDDVFASGADIRELAQLNAETARDFAARGQSILNCIANARQKTIAAINGYCMGGALDLVLACDVRIASKNAVFAHPGANLGIITGWGGTQRLPRLIGQARALELFMTARRIESNEALEFGLISEIYDPVLERALQTGRNLAADKRG